ncbi:MAG: acyltransferase [Xanthomonadales bacterium]|nr:acyltransferase [Xanthomonadales bacterium]
MHDPPTSQHWAGRPEGGAFVAMWLLRTIVLRIGRPLARLLLYPITAYFVLRRGPERRASRAFLARVQATEHDGPDQPLPTPGLWQVFAHTHCFAATVLDRPLLLTGRMNRFDIRCHGLDDLRSQMALGRGVLILGAHVGSFEVLRVLGEGQHGVEVAILLDRARSPAITALLESLNPALAASVIDISQPSTQIMLKIKEAADRGALIGMLGDRRRADDPGLPARFLGRPARFPVAPYQIAAVLDIPVCLGFGLYRGGNRYDLHFERFADRLELPRRHRQAALTGCVQQYASRLEHHVRLAPRNWFNFYDFWQDNDAPAAEYPPDRAGPAADGGLAPGGESIRTGSPAGIECRRSGIRHHR